MNCEVENAWRCEICGSEKKSHYGKICEACYKKQYNEQNKEKLKQYQKQYREQNKERKKQQQKQYYEQNKERLKQYQKQYNKQNKERKKQQQKQYREQNKERLKQYQKQYRKQNKERIKQYREQNKERIKQQMKQYRKQNKERIKQQQKQYNEQNKERWKQYYEQNKTTPAWCVVCQKLFFVAPRSTKRGTMRGRFCSYSCSALWVLKYKTNKNPEGTDIERMMKQYLETFNIDYEFQKWFALPTYGTTVDLFIRPNICIYCDGAAFHGINAPFGGIESWLKDQRQAKELRAAGNKVFRIPGDEIRAAENDDALQLKLLIPILAILATQRSTDI
jgi:chemotaxis protein histidine kinase CheA